MKRIFTTRENVAIILTLPAMGIRLLSVPNCVTTSEVNAEDGEIFFRQTYGRTPITVNGCKYDFCFVEMWEGATPTLYTMLVKPDAPFKFRWNDGGRWKKDQYRLSIAPNSSAVETVQTFETLCHLADF